MLDLLSEWLQPLSAISSGLQMLGSPGHARPQLETAFARIAHELSAPGVNGFWSLHRETPMATQPAINAPLLGVPGLSPDLEEDAPILPTVPEYLARGQDLKRWWNDVESNGGPSEQFPLSRSFNRPTRSYGFFGEAPIRGKVMPVMGNVQEMFYDQTRAPASLNREGTEWLWAQLREFVMKYFMRVSSFREPETYVDASAPQPPSVLGMLSWCPREWDSRSGFGFTQLFNKPVGSQVIYPFPSCDRHAIEDQRDIGKIYEWLVLKVRIFDFSFRTRPFGTSGPELVFGLNEESYLVVHQDFVNYRERHLPGVLGEYGIGYAFVKSPTQGFFGYGPGEFDAAIELINFRIYETGYISVRMIFISNRPASVARLVFDPIELGLRFADVFSFGLASRFAAPAKDALQRLPLRVSFDPALSYVAAVNAISNGEAARSLCISKEQLEKLFLLQHFKQHYQTITGSLLTWRQVPNWLDEKNLPSWVISGLSS
jgi:hypothetical protein